MSASIVYTPAHSFLIEASAEGMTWTWNCINSRHILAASQSLSELSLANVKHRAEPMDKASESIRSASAWVANLIPSDFSPFRTRAASDSKYLRNKRRSSGTKSAPESFKFDVSLVHMNRLKKVCSLAIGGDGADQPQRFRRGSISRQLTPAGSLATGTQEVGLKKTVDADEEGRHFVKTQHSVTSNDSGLHLDYDKENDDTFQNSSAARYSFKKQSKTERTSMRVQMFQNRNREQVTSVEAEESPASPSEPVPQINVSQHSIEKKSSLKCKRISLRRPFKRSNKGDCVGYIKLCLQYFTSQDELRVIIMSGSQFRINNCGTKLKLKLGDGNNSNVAWQSTEMKKVAQNEARFAEVMYLNPDTDNMCDELSIKLYKITRILRRRKCVGYAWVRLDELDLNLDTTVEVKVQHNKVLNTVSTNIRIITLMCII